MSHLSEALNALEQELLHLREEIADARTLDAVQSREASRLRATLGQLAAERQLLALRGELRLGSTALDSFQRRFATLLHEEATYRQKHISLETRLEILKARMQRALTRLDDLRQTP